MPYAVYIIYSTKLDRYYIGHTADPTIRLARDHNGLRNVSTKAGAPWELRWTRWFETRSEAMSMEKAIKSRKSRSFIEQLITQKVTTR